MSFQPPITIAQAIDNIERNFYLLPAIQREFVWKPHQIEQLFDSIMRNYPIHSFLFWNVEGGTKSQYRFYSFLREYVQDFKTHNPEFNTVGTNDFVAVLDGQQRLTALYIGLKGSYAQKKPKAWRTYTEDNYPTKYLYLNILSHAPEEQNAAYEFRFLSKPESEREKGKWFRVGEILSLRDYYAFNQYMNKNGYGENEFSAKALATLHRIVHLDPAINYFLEKEQNIDKALNIFIRINSGGQPLSFSDLLMSIAVANWNQLNARKEIHGLVDEVFRKGFRISSDFVLRVFLYLHIKDIRYKVNNFTTQNVQLFEGNWHKIRSAIISVFELVKDNYGYTEKTLPSFLALLPIIYYVYHKGISNEIVQKTVCTQDRAVIKKWLAQVLVKRVFGGTTDALLINIRNVFTSNVEKTPFSNSFTLFPAGEIAATLRGTVKDMSLDNDYIDSLLQRTQKDDSLAFSILSLLYPHYDYKHGNYHKDHVFAASFFKKENLIASNIPNEKHDFYLNLEHYNSILNLQILDGNENMSKQDKYLEQWVSEECTRQGVTREKFISDHLLPDITDFNRFEEFISKRRVILRENLKTITL
jgi:uncharacterized protein with ParB-like and HNH nuclease domain